MTTNNHLSFAHMDVMERVRRFARDGCSEYQTRRMFRRMIYDLITPNVHNAYMWTVRANTVSTLIELADSLLDEEEL